jgi:lipoprotein NlpD
VARPVQKGIYHKVKDGETLWRIAQTYNVGIDEIVRSNNIPNAAHIEKNQLLFIPDADRARDAAPVEDTRKNEFAWPLKGKVISYFSQQSDSYLSNGIGIAASEGETVRASRAGRVVFADHLSGYAYTVILDHNDGYHSIYSQNSNVLVKPGDQVLKGDPLAQVGRNGDLAFLHFAIRKNARPDNPLYYLP